MGELGLEIVLVKRSYVTIYHTELKRDGCGMTVAEISSFPGELWTVSVKLRALSEVFSMACGDPPLGDEALKGISYLLRDMADDLSDIRVNLEAVGHELNAESQRAGEGDAIQSPGADCGG